MKKISFIIVLMMLFASVSASTIFRTFYGSNFGTRMSAVKESIKSRYHDAVDNGSTINFPAYTFFGNQRCYVTMTFAKNVLYKADINVNDAAPEFSYLEECIKEFKMRYPDLELKEITAPKFQMTGSEVFVRGYEASDGITDCVIYLSFIQNELTKAIDFKTHMLFREAKGFENEE